MTANLAAGSRAPFTSLAELGGGHIRVQISKDGCRSPILCKADTVGGIDWISQPSPNFDEQNQNSWAFDWLFGGAGIFAQN